MPDRRDPEDEVIGAIVATIVGFGAGLLFGKMRDKEGKKILEESRLRFPELLECDTGEPYAPVRAKPWYVQWSGCLIFGLVLYTLYFALYSVAALTKSFVGFLSGFVMVVGSGYATYWLWQKRKRWDNPNTTLSNQVPVAPLNLTQARLYTVTLPKNPEWHPETASRFMQHMLYTFGRITFQIVVEPGSISWRILDLRRGADPSVVKNAVLSFYPDAQVDDGEVVGETYTAPFYRYVMAFKQVDNPLFPITYVDKLTQFDPLASLTQEMSSLGSGERVIYTLFVSDYARFVYDQAEALLTVQPGKNPFRFLSPEGWVQAGVELTSQEKQRLALYNPDDQKVIELKLQNLVWHCLLLMQLDSPHLERVKQLARADSHIFQLKNLPYNALIWHEEPWPQCIQYVDSLEKAQATSTLGLLGSWLLNTDRKWQQFRLILDTQELAALWHLPHKAFSAPAIRWLSTKQKPLPVQLEQSREGVCLGDNVYRGLTRPVYLHHQDREAHMIVFGKAGTGKSTLLHNLIHQDIAQGSGVAVVDPHGNLVQDILRSSISTHREQDVVVWDLANTEYPPPMNLLSVPQGFDRTLAAAQIMGVLEKIYDDFANTQMADTLQNALETVMVDETGPTLRDIDRLFRDDQYRWSLLSNVNNPAVEDFWQDFQAKKEAARNEMIYPVLRRIRSFYSSPILYPILCHPDNLDFYSLMAQNKIILISLQPTKTVQLAPDSQQLLGALLVSQFQMAAMAQAATQSFYLYVDEAQRFVTTAIPEVFAEARKRKLHITLSNQYLEQLSGTTLKAVMGNVGAMIVFGCEEADAKDVLPYMKPHFAVEDLVQADNHHAAVVMRFKGEQLPAFSLVSLSAPQPGTHMATEVGVRQKSIECYTPKSRSEVMDWLKKRYTQTDKSNGQSDAEMFSEPIT